VMGAFLVALVLQVVLVGLQAMAAGAGSAAMGMMGLAIPLALFWLLKSFAYLLMGIVLVQVVLSWVNPFSPMSGIVNELSRPFLDPLRRILPTIGNVDLSPLVFFLLLQIVMMVLQSLLMGF